MSKALALDLTECSICTEVFKNPKCLPCIHTFCLDCIQQYAKNYTTEKLPCPICRQEFQIPENGLEKLPRNFFSQRLMEATVQQDEDSQKSQERLCDLCSELGDDQATLATFYCVDCDQYICNSCKIRHEKQRATKSHSLCSLEEQKSRMKILKSSPTFCSKHDDKKLELFCQDCKALVCLMCFAVSHHGHQCEDLKTCAVTFEGKLQENLLILEKEAISLEGALSKIDEYQKTFDQDCNTTEQAVEDDFKRMIELLEHEKSKILDDLHVHRKAEEKQLIIRKEEIASKQSNYLKLIDYSKRLCEEGTYCDLLSTAPSLLERFKINLGATGQDDVRPPGAIIYQVTALDPKPKLQSLLGKLLSKDSTLVDQSSLNTSDADLSKPAETLNVKSSSYAPSNYLAVVGFENGRQNYHIRNLICFVSLEETNKVLKFNKLPTKITPRGAGCVVKNELYTFISSDEGTLIVNKCGIRLYDTETKVRPPNALRINTSTYTEQITPGRMRHSVVDLDGIIYIIGGNPKNDSNDLDLNIILSKIQTFNPVSGVVGHAGYLKCGVYDAACLAYDNKIYVFGGSAKNDEEVNHIQVFDPYLKSCCIFKDSLPARPLSSPLRAVLYKDKAILIGEYELFVYDFITKTSFSRNRFSVDVNIFGVALYEDKIFIAGGGSYPDESIDDDDDVDDDTETVFTSEVKYISVADILDGVDDVKWKYHATLPDCGYIDVYGQVTDEHFL